MGDRESARPDFTAGAIDVDLGDAGAAALRIGDAAATDGVAGLILARRGPRLPSGLFSRGLDQRDAAPGLDVAKPERDRAESERRRHFVDERLDPEMDLRPNGGA